MRTILSGKNSVPTFAQRLALPTVAPSQRGFWSLVAFACLCVALMLILWIFWLTRPSLVPVIVGDLNRYEYAQLRNALGEPQSFFGADLADLVNRARLDWVADVHAQRNADGRIVVHAAPRFAIARFGDTKLLDDTGTPFVPADPDAFSLLSRRVYGADTQAIMQMMARTNRWFAPVNLQVEEIVLTNTHTWYLRFSNGMYVLSDDDKDGKKLFRFSVALANDLRHTLGTLEYADLRYNDGFAIKAKDVP